MAIKKEAEVKRKFKRPSALADNAVTKKKVDTTKKKPSFPNASADKKNERENVSIILDETHIEVTDENIPQESPQRQELAEELFQEPDSSGESPIEEKVSDEKATSVEGEQAVTPEKAAANDSTSAKALADDQAKVDEMVSQSAVVDQPANEEEDAKDEAKISHADQSENSSQNNAVVVEESNSLRWILILIILFLVGLMGGLFYFFILQNKPVEKPKSALKTVAVYSPSPTAAVVKNAFTIKVLNGSGVAGQAASVQTMLTSAGYNVVDIDNANTSNYTKTEIQAKDTVSKVFLTTLEQSLSDKYIVDTMVSPTKSDETDDVVVIIGSETK